MTAGRYAGPPFAMPVLRSFVILSALVTGSCAIQDSVQPGPRHRPDHHPTWTITGSVGVGNFSQETTGGPNDETDATLGQARFEFTSGLIGGGIVLEGIRADDDLHQGTATGPTDSATFEVFPHFTLRPTGGDSFRIPLRFGFAFGGIAQESALLATGDATFGSFAFQFEAEPEIDLVHSDDFRFSLYGGIRGGAGVGVVSVKQPGFDEDFETDTWTGAANAGVRFNFGVFDMAASYVYRLYHFDESDPENGATTPETEFEFDGIVLTFGARW